MQVLPHPVRNDQIFKEEEFQLLGNFNEIIDVTVCSNCVIRISYVLHDF